MTIKPKTPIRQFVIAPTYDPHKLVPREWIRRDSLLLLQEAERLLEAFPDRVAPRIAAEPEPTKRRAILEREVRRMVRKFNAAHKAMRDKLAATEH